MLISFICLQSADETIAVNFNSAQTTDDNYHNQLLYWRVAELIVVCAAADNNSL